MARQQLFNFKYDGDTIYVFTAESSSDVYYSINNGSSHSAGIRYRAEQGNFIRTSGKTLKFSEAESFIRDLLR